MSENKQPIYSVAFGEPIYTRVVNKRATNLINPSWQLKTKDRMPVDEYR